MQPEDAGAYLAMVAEALDTAPRTGSEADSPEGARTITMSDTLAVQIAANLREIARAM